MPGDYGVPKDRKGLLPWSHVVDRMNQARTYWVATVDANGRPHATPVDGVWLGDRLYFGGSPRTRRSRNLERNPATCVHLENGLDVVILHGDTELVHPDPAMSENLAEASRDKYGYAPPPDAYEARGVHVFRPKVVLAWKQFPKDATRWRL
jgi:nitroimidazol reductase NimA-like FMN-containing flavoprotein (pyridoxamine 5'-phosphate oxidase superfamily)